MNTSETYEQRLSDLKHDAAMLHVRTLSSLSSKRTMVAHCACLVLKTVRSMDIRHDYERMAKAPKRACQVRVASAQQLRSNCEQIENT
jgi:hypothetical protein